MSLTPSCHPSGTQYLQASKHKAPTLTSIKGLLDDLRSCKRARILVNVGLSAARFTAALKLFPYTSLVHHTTQSTCVMVILMTMACTPSQTCAAGGRDVDVLSEAAGKGMGLSFLLKRLREAGFEPGTVQAS